MYLEIRLLATRDPTRDGWLKEFVKRKWSSVLFWAVGAAEEKKIPTAISKQLFEAFFFYFFMGKKNGNLFENIVPSTLKNYII